MILQWFWLMIKQEHEKEAVSKKKITGNSAG